MGKNHFPSLALAPISVLPEFQGKGVGSLLIHESHQVARELGFESVILLGHEQYYPRFGYVRASKYNIKVDFPAPDENVMAIELLPNGLKDIQGTVMYPDAFFA